MSDRLGPILERKRKEIAARIRHRSLFDPSAITMGEDRGPAALAALRRKGGPLRVIAEVKFASPSEGSIRARSVGDDVEIARGYATAGAAAISVLCDRGGFDGSVLGLRRAARAVDRPVLFKDFVLDGFQVELARAAGASLILLLVRALPQQHLDILVRFARQRGLEPVVEAADEAEVDRALATSARIVGVNARDLSSFAVDPDAAARAIQKIPENRVAVYMSGVSTPSELARVANGRADAVLIGTHLMRQPDPGEALRALIEGARQA
jgi:indole-3-glycerol phosphate synthase